MNRFLLYGLFTALKEAGLPISTADFIDGVRAINLVRENVFSLAETLRETNINFVTEEQRGSRSTVTRETLIWLCQTLWARNNSERELIASTILKNLPYTDDRILQQILDEASNNERVMDEYSFQEPEPRFSVLNKPGEKVDGGEMNQETPQREVQKIFKEVLSIEEGHYDAIDEAIDADLQEELDREIFWDTYNVPLISPPDYSIDHFENYSFKQPSNPSYYALITVWRRLFRSKKVDDEGRIDVNKSTQAICKKGFLDVPIFERKYQPVESLVVLIDVGSSMSPWESTTNDILKSLSSNLSPLKSVSVYYFEGILGDRFFKTTTTREPIELNHITAKHRNSVYFVLSDAGAAKGRFTDYSIEDMKSFFSKKEDIQSFISDRSRTENAVSNLMKTNAKYLLWINPMPKYRWQESWCEIVKKIANIYVTEVEINSLVQIANQIKYSE